MTLFILLFCYFLISPICAIYKFVVNILQIHIGAKIMTTFYTRVFAIMESLLTLEYLGLVIATDTRVLLLLVSNATYVYPVWSIQYHICW